MSEPSEPHDPFQKSIEDSGIRASEQLFSRVESRRTFESLVNSMPLCLLIKDAEGRRVFANHAYLHVRRTTMSELMGKRDEDLFPAEIAHQYTADDQSVIQSGKSLHSVEPTVDAEGRVRWIERIKSPIRDQEDNVTGLQLLFWDVTERIEARQQLDFERHLLRTLMQNLPDSIYFKDTDSRFIRISQAMAEKFGFKSEDELVGKTDADIFSDEHADSARKDEMQIIRTGEPLVDRVERETWHDREDTWCISTKMPFLDDTGRVIGTFGISRDISDLMRSQQELREARDVADKANHAKSEFLANMSHEIRTPMNAIIGMSELLTQTDLTQEQQDYAELIRESAGSLLGIINDILDFSKIEARKLDLEEEPFSIRDLVEKTGRTLSIRAAEKSLELACRVAPSLPEIWIGDSGRLRQILINLVANGIKFTSKGEVTINVSAAEYKTAEVQGSSQSSQIEFAVKDTGIGIPEDKQAAVMEAFTQADASTTRKFGGTGLGLAISRQLVELMGGRLEIESVEGVGTTFRFSIPLKVGASETEISELDAQLRELRDLRVLVVDDNATNRRILDEILCSWKMKPALASSGEEALELLERSIANGEPFRFAILDCMMPGMDGFELAEAIRKRQNAEQIRLMILSSAKTPNNNERCTEIGIQRYMNKPVVQSDLKDAVVKIMQSASAGNDRNSGQASAAVRSLRVLVAEDGLANQHVAMGLLKAAGHEPFLACDGKEAVERWKTGTYDVILMDMHMPEMDGLEATRAIRALEKERAGNTDDMTEQHRIPIIAVTAAATPQDARECEGAGMDDFLTKPIRTKFLQEMLSKHAPRIRPGEEPSVAGGQVVDDALEGIDLEASDLEVVDDEEPEFQFPPASDVADLQAASFEISGGIDGLQRLTRIFRDECDSIFKTIDMSIAQGDHKSLARAAHTLKGSAQLFRAKRVVAAASKLEDSVSSSETSDFTAMADEVRAETTELLSLLSRLS